MSQPLCPKCSQPLKDDYGMATCASCGSFVFVDMDGLAHFSEDEPARTAAARKMDPRSNLPPSAEPAGGLAFGDDEQSIFDQQNSASSSESLQAPLSPAYKDQTYTGGTTGGPISLDGSQDLPGGGFASPSTDDFGVASSGGDEPVSDFAGGAGDSGGGGFGAGSVDVQCEDFDMDKMLGYQEPVVEAPSADFAQPGDPLGTTEYANSEISQAKDGPLIFKILISGIDSKEMRESLRSALDDQRFGWNPNDLMSRISKGLLTIDNVAPVKAVILINRIKRLPLKIGWEQYAITQMG
jgi:hypothetical protein